MPLLHVGGGANMQVADRIPTTAVRADSHGSAERERESKARLETIAQI
jgi:hypothetical protein